MQGRYQCGRSSQHRAAHRSGRCFRRVLHPRVHRMQALERQWQHLNRMKYPRLAAKINQEQAESAALVEQLNWVANICLDNGEDCSFEWPRYCTGWALPSCQPWTLERNLHLATFSQEALEISYLFIALGQESCSFEVRPQ